MLLNVLFADGPLASVIGFLLLLGAGFGLIPKLAPALFHHWQVVVEKNRYILLEEEDVTGGTWGAPMVRLKSSSSRGGWSSETLDGPWHQPNFTQTPTTVWFKKFLSWLGLRS